MRILLDTHILLWWLADDKSLSAKARKVIASSDNLVFVSSVSAWEIAIKKALGKLKAPDDLETAVKESDFQLLPINFAHAMLAGKLKRHHDDPFDRMLIAQAKAEGLTIMTHDKKIKRYQVSVLLV